MVPKDREQWRRRQAARGCWGPHAVLLHVSYKSSWFTLNQLKDSHHADGSCCPSAEAFVPYSREGQQWAVITSQQPRLAVGMTPVPAWHMGECILAATCYTAFLTQPQWPNVVKPDHSLHPRQSDRTPIGMNLGGAQDCADRSPSF